eukprot:TRINITY_DN13444_c0_g1_i1.p1 TRINITY_DN13444_c0_g1~~TRINITY_DN13444_c0_g1_i1.p1  ORF type:complete len:687 (+),score=101.79 TRINITY_DN13444_c0_g1_i1:59-2119(+)
MACSELKQLVNVSLHPAHTAAQVPGSIQNDSAAAVAVGSGPGSQFFLRPFQSEGCSPDRSKEWLEDLLQQFISSERGCREEESSAAAIRVCLNSTAVVIDCNGQHSSIPVFFADAVEAVVPTKQGFGYLVALAPRVEASTARTAEKDPPLREVWVFSVSGEHLDLKRFLFDLGARGAIRWDLDECYTMTRKPLGEGGFGKIFVGQSIMAKNIKENRSEENNNDVLSISQVAIKVLHSRSSIEMMRREVGFLARTGHHPNITGLYGVFCSYGQRTQRTESQSAGFDGRARDEARGCCAIVMELCNSGDLFDFLSNGPMCSNDCAILVHGLSTALNHLHEMRIIHRDVKPENILIGAHMQPILADLGEAVDLDDAAGMQNRRGSVGYAAPEVLTGEPYDERADIFSAGIVYYQALSLQHPFLKSTQDETMRRTVRCQIKFPRSWFGQVSTGLLNLVRDCASKDPEKRPCAELCIAALSQHPSVRSTIARAQAAGSSSSGACPARSASSRSARAGADDSVTEVSSSSVARPRSPATSSNAAAGASASRSPAMVQSRGAEAAVSLPSRPPESLPMPSRIRDRSIMRVMAERSEQAAVLLPTPPSPSLPRPPNTRARSLRTADCNQESETAKAHVSISSRISRTLRSVSPRATRWVSRFVCGKSTQVVSELSPRDGAGSTGCPSAVTRCGD